MDAAEFAGEWDRACLMWGKDPEAKQQRMVRALWEQMLKRETRTMFRAAMDRLSGQDPRHFPTIGEVRATLAAMRSAHRNVLKQAEEVTHQLVQPFEYRDWAEELDALAIQYDNANRPGWSASYRALAQHWRMNATLREDGMATIKPSFQAILREHNAEFRVRPMPMPEPEDFADDGRE